MSPRPLPLVSTWPDKCSFCAATALSSFRDGALCVDHYRTFFRMHDALNQVNGLTERPVVDAVAGAPRSSPRTKTGRGDEDLTRRCTTGNAKILVPRPPSW